MFPMRDRAYGSDLLAEPCLQRHRVHARQNKSTSEPQEEAKRGQNDVILLLFGSQQAAEKGPFGPPRGPEGASRAR